ncbi:MAG: hypothetical protein CMH21_13145 [Methylophaga sp.]|jgi:hypothetical protein|nr:hypothetical protein [Methylophaga sp.]MAY18664.1 hypothetical protein [Methylophaga sp.]HAO25998.1 hypothetical protein [Methylophaga sp.]HCD06623.1 hypothetical protein [Methylophaga sp.]|tara:strand:+ start:45947 stop:46180 length:234 start_codon:yes stop_codon:yes gene_type:complete
MRDVSQFIRFLKLKQTFDLFEILTINRRYEFLHLISLAANKERNNNSKLFSVSLWLIFKADEIIKSRTKKGSVLVKN